MRCASSNDHLLGIHHEPDRAAFAVAQDLVHRDQVHHEALHVGVDVVAGKLQVEERLGDRPCGGEDPLLPREHLLEPPAGDVRERKQPQRLAGWRAVDDDRVELTRLAVALDLKQREELVEPGRHRHLLGHDLVDAAIREQRAEPLLHGLPVALHLTLGLKLLAPQLRRDRRRLAAERRLERVGQAVRRVGREDDGRAGRLRRLRARWRPRRSSSRPRPCPCTGSSGAP